MPRDTALSTMSDRITAVIASLSRDDYAVALGDCYGTVRCTAYGLGLTEARSNPHVVDHAQQCCGYWGGAVLGVVPTSTVAQPRLPFGPVACTR